MFLKTVSTHFFSHAFAASSIKTVCLPHIFTGFSPLPNHTDVSAGFPRGAADLGSPWGFLLHQGMRVAPCPFLQGGKCDHEEEQCLTQSSLSLLKGWGRKAWANEQEWMKATNLPQGISVCVASTWMHQWNCSGSHLLLWMNSPGVLRLHPETAARKSGREILPWKRFPFTNFPSGLCLPVKQTSHVENFVQS